MNLVFKCAKENDLYRVLKDLGLSFPRYTTLAKAINAAAEGGAVLSLADDYPRPVDRVDAELLDRAGAKKLRMLVEYPLAFPGRKLGEPRPTVWERVVTTSEFFAPNLGKESILAMHGCWFLPTKAGSAHLSLARLAGYRKSAYGLPKETFPILYEIPGCNVLVATSKLSQFVTARYAPKPDWKTVWEAILRWLCPNETIPTLDWKPTVTLQAGREAKLPKTAEMDALSRSTKWFREQVVYSIDLKKGAVE